MKRVANRNHRLGQRDLTVIANLVREMDVQLRPTWTKVIEIARSVTKKEFSRQSLCAHQEIDDAYQDAVNRHALLRQERGQRIRPAPLSGDQLEEQKLANQAREIAEQAEQIEAYQDLLIRFIGNAMLAGITQERLEAPLEARDEWRSDLDQMADRTREARRKQRRQ